MSMANFTAVHRYRAPSWKWVSLVGIPAASDIVRENLKKELKGKFVSMTADGWRTLGN